MNDILPEEMPRWQRMEDTFRRITARYGYGEVRTPLVEPTSLFVRGVGEATDMVEKEMYSFVDKGDDALTLRPEGTASAVRAWIEHNVGAKHPVAKWIYLGPMYRRERPAKGRYRQFHQAGAEVYGDAGPFVDAEMIDMVVGYLRELGIAEIEVLVNSIGGPGTRPAYRAALLAYLEPHRSSLCPDCQRRLDTNPLRVLDCKVESDRAIARDAPSVLDHLDAADREHFDELRRTLDALGTPYRVDPRIVRGLDYYTRTIFEVVGRSAELGAQSTICGGGRYDGMIEQLGGPATPAIGFAIGLERLLLMTAGQPIEVPRTDVFVATVSPEMRGEAAKLAKELRAVDLVADADLRGQSLKSQLRRAGSENVRARYVIILGKDESARGVVQLKDYDAQSQSEVPRSEVVTLVRDRVKGRT